MPPEFILAIVFFAVGLPIICGTLIALAKIIKGKSETVGGRSKKNDPASDRQESEIVQEINQLVTRLEKRIDALETIVLDQAKR